MKKQHKDLDNNTLAGRGFKRKITFQQQKDISRVKNNTKNRERKIIWFDPPYSPNVSTNISK